MEINWHIDKINKNTLEWRILGTDHIILYTTDEGEIVTRPLYYSIYGQLNNVTQFTVDYVKTQLGEKVVEFENKVLKNLQLQRNEMGEIESEIIITEPQLLVDTNNE